MSGRMSLSLWGSVLIPAKVLAGLQMEQEGKLHPVSNLFPKKTKQKSKGEEQHDDIIKSANQSGAVQVAL